MGGAGPDRAGVTEVDLLIAPAKLTWELHVTGLAGNGYHLLDAEMTTLDAPRDELELRSADRSLLFVGEDPTPVTSDNLILAALAATGRTAEVRLQKSIPVGAGLGGGSADAAAVLRWAGVHDIDVAVALGADVPFCLVGGRARVTGIGEVVTPLEPRPRKVTLLSPPLHVSTPAVYRAWDELGGPTHERNDLTAAALVVAPELAGWRDRFAEVTGIVPTLAGSGGTWFVEGHHEVVVDGVETVRATTV